MITELRKRIRCAVIEDEQCARETLMKLLSRYCPEVEIVGEAESVADAVTLLQKTKPDLVFLDIELIGGTGFDVLEQVKPYDFTVVFTTAYEKYKNDIKEYPRSRILMKPAFIQDLRNSIKDILSLK